ncbi:MAG: ABC transporter ATP-binding protein [Oculatellaceae cyanobacterium bins.114]|nr:ABC transporter ATP-binding protein [Oculatellaceae cyanobacterium bins.114]
MDNFNPRTLMKPKLSRKTRFWAMMANTPRLLRLVWNAAPIWLLITLGITVIGALIPVGQLYVNKLIVDQVVGALEQPTTDWRSLFILIGLGLGLTLAQGAVNQGNVYVSQILSDRFTLHSNDVLLKQAVRLDLAHYELPEFHDTLNRAQQSGSNYPVRVLNTLTTLAGQIITFAGLLTLLLSFNPIILLLLLVTSLPAFWVGMQFSGRRFWMLRHQTESGRMAEYLQRVLLSQEFVKEVRLFNLSDYLLHQWRDIRMQVNQESQALAAQQASARFGIGLAANLSFYGAYAWVVVQTVRGVISVGDLTMYSGAFQQAQNVMQNLLLNVASMYESNLYVSQYFEFLDLKPQVVNLPSPKAFPQPIQSGLTLRHVTFTYPGAAEPTLVDLNLTVQPGESVALVGANGAGKTTLLKLLTRFYDIDSGEIAIDGIPLRELDLQDLWRNVGVVFQDFARYNLTVQDNIGFGDIQQRGNLERIEGAAIAAGAADVIAKLEQGYGTILGKTFTDSTELSGGQWQKIGLSRAFMTPAQILILDEPTAALDAIAEYDLFQRFRQLTQSKMTFLVSHRFSTVRMADRIVVLDQGRIVEVGSHGALMQQGGLYEHMFRLQASSYEL